MTDIIELARNRAISDAVVLSGDEDVRSGVQIAQSYGIRVHLLGIAPSVGNQSNLLRQEADSVSEWGRDKLIKFMSVDTTVFGPPIEIANINEGARVDQDKEWVSRVVAAAIAALGTSQLNTIAKLSDSEGIPPQIDRLLLGICKRTIGILSSNDRWKVRDEFKKAARRAVAAGQDSVTSP